MIPWSKCMKAAVFLALLSSFPTCSAEASAGEPPWKAPSAVPLLRDVDRIIERAKPDPSVFAHPPVRKQEEAEAVWESRIFKWTEQTQPLRDLLETLHHTKLLTEPCWLTLSATKLVAAEDGSFVVEGFFDPHRPPRSFVSTAEAATMNGWEIRRQEMEQNYARAVDDWRRSGGGSDDPALFHGHRRQLFDQERAAALGPIEAAIHAREEGWRRVEVVLRCSPSKLAEYDRDRMLRAKSLRVLFVARELTVAAPIPAADMPAATSSIIGEILELEPNLRLPTARAARQVP